MKLKDSELKMIAEAIDNEISKFADELLEREKAKNVSAAKKFIAEYNNFWKTKPEALIDRYKDDIHEEYVIDKLADWSYDKKYNGHPRANEIARILFFNQEEFSSASTLKDSAVEEIKKKITSKKKQ